MATKIEDEIATWSLQRPRTLPETLRPLERLAWNYWWSWAPDGPGVFRDLDAEVWEKCEHNPRRLLRQVSELRQARMACDPVYVRRVARIGQNFDHYMSAIGSATGNAAGSATESTGILACGSPASLPAAAGITPDHPVAYFCAEYGIHNSLPLYSGGLGMLAGDHLKSASDLNLPLVAVGLLYRFGYFHQRLRPDGWQEDYYGETDTAEVPIQLISDDRGEEVRVEVAMRGRTVRARVWRANVGRVQLYLLDTNIEENEETDRFVTGHLYGGDRETRIVQEMMLGIGGVRLLRRLGIAPRVFHLNEGHAAFVTVELARELMAAEGIDFAEAALRVRKRCVFTTHTPVAAGHDEFESELVERAFDGWYETALGLSGEEFLALGRVNGQPAELFGLTPLAIRMSRSTNGVSRKHAEVSRALWQGLWPERAVVDVPISYVTNGVHAATWVAPLIRALYEQHIGKDWVETSRDAQAWAAAVQRIPDDELWQAHCLLRQRLVAFVRQNSYPERLAREENGNLVDASQTMLDGDILTIGFARRVAGYKRWGLLLSDKQRLSRLINDRACPVQFVFAGKAHPQDEEGKLVLQRLMQWSNDNQSLSSVSSAETSAASAVKSYTRHRIAFLEDYDQDLARLLVQSVDVWLNVPRRPFEASGSSGQKVAINGGVNFSVLDGWWLEGYDGTNGFAIGSTSDEGSGDVDERDAASLYRVLENEIIPLYYERDAEGIPRRWVALMKHSIATLVPVFNSDRMVAEYAERIYA